MELLDGKIVSQAVKDDLKFKVSQLKKERKNFRTSLQYWLELTVPVKPMWHLK